MALPTKFWKGNNQNGNVAPYYVTIAIPDATPGATLVAFLVDRFGQQLVPVIPVPNWTLTYTFNHLSPANHIGWSFEKVANGSDDFIFDPGGDRASSAIVVELPTGASLDSVSIPAGTQNGWYTASTFADTGTGTPSAQPGIAIALLGIKDTQDWVGDNVENSVKGIAITNGFSVIEGSVFGGLPNLPISVLSFLEYSDLSAIEARWTNTVNVSDYVMGGLLLYTYGATQPEGTNIFIGDQEVTEVYIGDQKITAAYIGDQKIFGP